MAQKDPQNGSKTGKLVLVIGPSGVGKSAVLHGLRKLHPEYHYPRSATTRPRREGEDDTLYHFLTDEEFDRYIAEKKFIEWQTVHKTARYGTLVEEIIPQIEAGKTVIREIEVQGFDAITHDPRFSGPDAPYRLLSIFILPPSTDELIARIRGRSAMPEEELRKRLESMKMEMGYADQCTARIVNEQGKLEDAIKAVEGVIEG